MEEAIQSATEFLRWHAVEVELEEEDGKAVYEIKLVNNLGDDQEVEIDALSGTVLEAEAKNYPKKILRSNPRMRKIKSSFPPDAVSNLPDFRHQKKVLRDVECAAPGPDRPRRTPSTDRRSFLLLRPGQANSNALSLADRAKSDMAPRRLDHRP